MMAAAAERRLSTGGGSSSSGSSSSPRVSGEGLVEPALQEGAETSVQPLPMNHVPAVIDLTE